MGLGLTGIIAGFMAMSGCGEPGGKQAVRRRPLPVEWSRPIDEPCLDIGSTYEHLFAPCVYSYKDGYRMLYAASKQTGPRLFELYLADSEDGLTWRTRCGAPMPTKHPTPVLAFGSGPHERAGYLGDGKTSLVTPALVRQGSGWVHRVNGKLRLYVVAVEFGGDGIHRLYMTTSEDGGMTWAPLSGPLMEHVYAPSILFEDGRYRMWYVDVSADPWRIRLAESGDGIMWEPADPEPVLEVDQAWEEERLFYPCVIRETGYENDRYLMWYGAYWSERDDTTAIGLAVSDDGIHWHKYADNPVITPDPERPFESNYCTSHTVLPHCRTHESGLGALFGSRVCDGYQIWYATRNEQVQKHKYFAIGTAVSVGPHVTNEEETIVAAPEFSMSAQRANDARLEPLHYLQRYGQETEYTHAFTATNREEWNTWRRSFRRKLANVIGLSGMDAHMPATKPREMRVVKGPVEKLKGYTRHAFTIETAPGLWVPAFLLVPEGLDSPRPAILCSHGHGIGMNALVGLTEEGKPRQYKKGYQHDFALQAVKAGFVALAFEQCGFGRRRDIDFNKEQNLWNHCEQPSKNALHWGLSMTGIRVWDAMRMIDFLQTRPEVQAGKIGMVGISGGGLVTQFTAALDDRVQAACVSGFCNRFADCILAIHHCIDNYVPGLGRLGDNDDVACLIAPKPLLIESGTEDNIFPIAATRAALRKLRRCYRLLDASDRIEADIFEGKHEFSGARTWTFFAKHLGEPVEE